MTNSVSPMLRRQRQTKIVSTLGPASSSLEMVRALFVAGVDTFRLNFSHGSHEDHGERYRLVRQVEKEFGRPIGIFADLQGPKLRLGQFEGGFINVTAGHQLWLDSDKTLGGPERVYLPHPEIITALNVGDPLLVDDGKVSLKVIEKKADAVKVEVVVGHKLMDRKGINIPATLIQMSVLTEKDRKDLAFALDLGVDWIALSFVQRPEDITEARALIGDRAGIIAKIEKPMAIDSLEGIVALTDAVMLARGDLGVEIPAEQVPVVQKRAVQIVREAGKPLIIATQMLESMINSPTPTRAEASDVATAVFDGADAVMTSAETASGEFPLEAVGFMDKVARTVETSPVYADIMNARHPQTAHTTSNAITAAAHHVAQTLDAKAIATFSTSGQTALRMVRERPNIPVVCMSPDEKVVRRLALSFGANPVLVSKQDKFDDLIKLAKDTLLQHKFANSGETAVVTCGELHGESGKTNTLRVVSL
jgi:pyruvate kinase